MQVGNHAHLFGLVPVTEHTGMNEAMKFKKTRQPERKHMVFNVGTSGFTNLNPQGQFTPQHSGTGDVHNLKCYRLSIFTYEFKEINPQSSPAFM